MRYGSWLLAGAVLSCTSGASDVTVWDAVGSSMTRCYVACPVPPFWAARCAGHGNTPESVHPSGVRNSSHASFA